MDETQEQLTARIVAQTATATALAVADAANAAALALAKENTVTLTEIAVLKTEMAIMKNQQTCFENAMTSRMDNLDPKFEKIFNRLNDVALGRPTWAVALLIGGLSSVCVGLIVFTASHI